MKRKRHWSYTGEKRRLRVLRRDNYECQIRGPRCLSVANVVDHIVPRELGGSEDERNLQAACAPCNRWKGSTPGTPLPPAFFRNRLNPRSKLHSISPQKGRWGAPVATDYSRKAGNDGDSAA